MSEPKLKVTDCLKERLNYPEYQAPITLSSTVRLGTFRTPVVVIAESCQDPNQRIQVTLYPRG